MKKVSGKWQGMVLALVVLISFGISGRALATFDTGGTSIVFATSNFWEPVGGKDFVSTGGWGTVNIAFSPTTNEPYIEYMDWSKGGIAIKKFNGSGWETVGNANFNSNGFEQASIAFGPESSEVYVAYSDGISHKATVRRYDGSQWVPVGNTNFTSSEAIGIKLAFSPSTKRPYIAYRNYAGKITVQEYNGSQWRTVGNAGFNSNGTYNTSFAFDPGNGQPYVAYSDWGNGKITIKKFDGSQWITVGNANFNSIGTSYADLVFNPKTNQPYIAYGDWSGGEITVRRLEGSQWNPVGNVNFNNGKAFSIRLAFDPVSGQPYVAYNDEKNSHKVSVAKLDGSQWIPVGNSNFGFDLTYQVGIAFNPATNMPWVICNDGGGITVMKLGEEEQLPETISLNKTSYNIGENITVSWTPSISDSKKYKISAYGNDGGFAWFPNLIGSSRNIQLSRAGIYRVFIEPNYGLGTDPASNTVMLTVTNELPGATTVSTTKKTYYENEDVVVKWSAAKYATEYGIYIDKKFSGTVKQLVGSKEVSYKMKLPVGEHTVAVSPQNLMGCGLLSNSVKFKVVKRTAEYPWNESNCPMGGYIWINNAWVWADYASTIGSDGEGHDGGEDQKGSDGYGCRQCASYVAWRIYQETTNFYPYWGDAWMFYQKAKEKFGAGDGKPHAGSIAVMDGTEDFPLGHVAWVETEPYVKNGKSYIKVSQYNYNFGDGHGLPSMMFEMPVSAFDHYVRIIK